MSLKNILAQMEADNSYSIWLDSDTLALIKAYRIIMDGTVIDNKKGWPAVTALLQSQGIAKTINQVRKKWATLMKRYIAHSVDNAPKAEFRFYNAMEEMLGNKEPPLRLNRKSNISMKLESPQKREVSASSVDSIDEAIRSNEIDSIEDEEMYVISDSREEQTTETKSLAPDQWNTVQEQMIPVKDHWNTVEMPKKSSRHQRNPVQDQKHLTKHDFAQNETRLVKEETKKNYVNVVPIETLMDEYISSDSSNQKPPKKRKKLSAKDEYYEAKRLFIENENRRREADVRDKIRSRNEKNQILKEILEAIFVESEQSF